MKVLKLSVFAALISIGWAEGEQEEISILAAFREEDKVRGSAASPPFRELADKLAHELSDCSTPPAETFFAKKIGEAIEGLGTFSQSDKDITLFIQNRTAEIMERFEGVITSDSNWVNNEESKNCIEKCRQEYIQESFSKKLKTLIGDRLGDKYKNIIVENLTGYLVNTVHNSLNAGGTLQETWTLNTYNEAEGIANPSLEQVVDDQVKQALKYEEQDEQDKREAERKARREVESQRTTCRGTGGGRGGGAVADWSQCSIM